MSFSYIKNTYHRNLGEHFLFSQREKIHGEILDAGSGSRRYDHWFSGKVTAFDIVPNIEHDVVYGNLDETLDFPDNHFDAFICIEALQYTKDFRIGIRELFRVLKPGGYGVMVVPHYYPEHGENFHFSKRFINSELASVFSEVHATAYGNFYTVWYDLIRLKIRDISWRPLRVGGFALWSVVARILHLCLKEEKTDQFYSGTFLLVRK